MLINVFRIIRKLQVSEFDQGRSWTLQGSGSREPDLRITATEDEWCWGWMDAVVGGFVVVLCFCDCGMRRSEMLCTWVAQRKSRRSLRSICLDWRARAVKNSSRERMGSRPRELNNTVLHTITDIQLSRPHAFNGHELQRVVSCTTSRKLFSRKIVYVCSPSLHLFALQYSKGSNIVKYIHYLK